MSISNPDVIDGLGISTTDGKAVLMISDHLAWHDSKAHFDLLEKKINAYLAFIQSGQFLESLPAAEGKHVRIELIHEHAPNDAGIKVISAAQQQLSKLGVEFLAMGLPEQY
jgi:hypothetical protein